MTSLMDEQIAEGQSREARALAETAGRRWTSEVDEHGNQQYVAWGDIPVEIAPDPEEQLGSPEYLALLADMKAGGEWDTYAGVDAAWEALGENPDDQALLSLAEETFALISELEVTDYEIVLDKAADLHIRKNRGYSGQSKDRWANFRLATKFGVTPLQGVLVRMSDKFIRIQNLRANPDNDQVNESIIDTLMDLAAYALIAVCLLRETAHRWVDILGQPRVCQPGCAVLHVNPIST